MKKYLLITALLFTGISIAQEEVREVPPPPVPIEEEEPVRKSVMPPPPPGPARTAEVAEIADFPDAVAEFPGGVEAMQTYIMENIEYPEIARELGDQGRVYVTFIVERDGSISNIEVMRGGLTPELNREAIRVVREMPRWIPAEVKDQAVRARCRLPITFILETPKKEKKEK